MKLFYFLFTTIVLTNCLQVKKRTIKENTLYHSLVSLEKKLVNKDLTLNKEVADSLFRRSLFFDSIFPESQHKEKVLVFAAKSADGMNENEANLKIINQLVKHFPNSKNTPIYLYNKGKIYEEKLMDTPTALVIYKQIVKQYPESDIAKNLIDYISFISKTENEQLKQLKQQK